MARPRCLLLSGMLCDDEVFAAQADALTSRYDVQVANLTWWSVDLAVAAILHSQPARFSLVGFSLGGIVAASCAARAPDRVDELVLIATNPAGPRPDQRAQWDRWRADIALGRFDDVADEATAAMLTGVTDDAQWALANRMAARTGPYGLLRQLALQSTRRDLHRELERIRARTTLVAGQDDPLCPVTNLEAIRRAVPDATLTVFANCGHLVPVVRAAELNELLSRPQSTRSASTAPR